MAPDSSEMANTVFLRKEDEEKGIENLWDKADC